MGFLQTKKRCETLQVIPFRVPFATQVLLDCTDLLKVFQDSSTVTGIDRVQIQVFDYLLTKSPERDSDRFKLVFRCEDGFLNQITFDAARSLINVLAEPRSRRLVVERIVADCRASASPAIVQAGDLYFIPGPFWTSLPGSHPIAALKARGVVIGAYIYDLIPLTHPQFCETTHRNVFAAAFADIAPQLDFALTISEFVATELRRLLTQHDLFVPPILSVPLAHELDVRASPGVAEMVNVLDRFGGKPFVLCVGTVEIRKNHLYLMNLWRTLEAEGIELPLLVFAGRLGWRVTDLQGQLEAVRYCNDVIRVVSDASDADLACLYDNCLFTIFPSFVEGWGLPVGESLARGKVVVASAAASIPEVGGKHALYIDPHNLHSGVEIVRRLLTDRTFREAQEAAIRSEFRPRTWADAGKRFHSALIEGYEAHKPRKAFSPLLDAGRVLTISELVEPAQDLHSYLRHPLRLLLHWGWRPVDGGGSWIFDKRAVIRFDTGAGGIRPITVLMTFVTVPWLDHSALVLSCASHHKRDPGPMRTRRLLQPGVMFRQAVQALTDDDGVATIDIEIEGTPRANPPQEPRVLWVRMVNVGWCVADDPLGRVGLLEQVVCA